MPLQNCGKNIKLLDTEGDTHTHTPARGLQKRSMSCARLRGHVQTNYILICGVCRLGRVFLPMGMVHLSFGTLSQ